MVAAIADCQVLLARGMGAGAFASMQQAGIEPIVTDIEEIGAAVEAYLAGTLRNQVEKLHQARGGPGARARGRTRRRPSPPIWTSCRPRAAPAAA